MLRSTSTQPINTHATVFRYYCHIRFEGPEKNVSTTPNKITTDADETSGSVLFHDIFSYGRFTKNAVLLTPILKTCPLTSQLYLVVYLILTASTVC